MSEDYRVQVTISLPPAGQYAKGDMLNVRGQDADDILSALTGLFDAEAAVAIIQKFRTYAVTTPGTVSADEVMRQLSAAPAPVVDVDAAYPPPPGGYRRTTTGGSGGPRKNATPKQLGLIQNIATEKGLGTDAILDIAAAQVTSKGFRPKSLEQLSSFEASKLIDALRDHAGNVA